EKQTKKNNKLNKYKNEESYVSGRCPWVGLHRLLPLPGLPTVRGRRWSKEGRYAAASSPPLALLAEERKRRTRSSAQGTPLPSLPLLQLPALTAATAAGGAPGRPGRKRASCCLAHCRYTLQLGPPTLLPSPCAASLPQPPAPLFLLPSQRAGQIGNGEEEKMASFFSLPVMLSCARGINKKIGIKRGKRNKGTGGDMQKCKWPGRCKWSGWRLWPGRCLMAGTGSFPTPYKRRAGGASLKGEFMRFSTESKALRKTARRSGKKGL
ncbi:hypothetical protein Taro_011886, partial [Colocasia esculenta]|nr:hypothetical protein [Colocasia esculenta]